MNHLSLKKLNCMLILSFLFGIVGIGNLSAACHKGHHSEHKKNEHCSSKALCPKKFRLPRVVLADTPVQPQGSEVYNITDGKVYVSDGKNWIPFEFDVVAPALITVDPSKTSNGVTTFKTIQAAIDSLGDQQILDTTIKIANGTYPERLLLQSLLCSDAANLKFIGDARAIVGVGINHGSFWNAVTGGSIGPVGGGVGSIAKLSSSGNVVKVKNIGSGSDPDFVAANVTAGDRVAIRHDDGTFAIYPISNVTATSLTLTGLTKSVDADGAALTIIPKVEIAPPQSTTPNSACIETHVAASFSGLFVNVLSPDGQGIELATESFTYMNNIFVYSGSVGIFTEVFSPVVFPAQSAIYACRTPLGFTIFNPTGGVGLEGDQAFGFVNGLLSAVNDGSTAIAVGGLGSISANFAGAAGLNGGGFRTIGSVGITSGSHLVVNAPSDVFVTSGTGVSFDTFSTLELGVNFPEGFANVPDIGVRGAPDIGFDFQSCLEFASGFTSSLGVTSTTTNPGFVAVRLGRPGNSDIFGGPITASYGTITLGNCTVPAGGTLVEVNAGSIINFNLFLGVPFTSPPIIKMGEGSTGFRVQNGSTLIYDANGGLDGDFTTGNGGILFDVLNGSKLIINPSSTPREFSGFDTIFNFNDSSSGILNDFVSTTTKGGVNLSATNMSRVEIGNATFNRSGKNIGINSAPNGCVEKRVGATLTNDAFTHISSGSCTQLFTDPIGSYVCSKGTGVIVVSP